MTKRERAQLRRLTDRLFDLVVDLRERRGSDPEIDDDVLGTLQTVLSQVQGTYPITQ